MNDTIPYLLQWDDDINDYYKYMILRLLSHQYNLHDIYYGIINYLIIIKEIDIDSDEFKNCENIIRNNIILNFNRMRSIDNIVSNVVHNFFNVINIPITQNMESVKLVLNQEELDTILLKPFIEIDQSIKECNDNCTICKLNFNDQDIVRHVKCNHIFHKECIDPWFLDHSHLCPCCRSEVGKYIAKL